MILYVNFVTSTFPALALSIEPTHKKVMLQLPRRPDEKLLSDYIITKIAVITPTMIFSALILFLWELRVVGSSLPKAMTIAFAVMVVSGALHTFNARRLHTTLFDDGFFNNKYVFWSVLVSVFFTVLTIHTDVGRRIFETVELSIFDWGLVFLFGALIILVSEIIKLSTKQEIDEHNSLHGTHIRID
jgi:Ca2+-transporting ATPase